MMSILASHPCNWSPGVREQVIKGRFIKVPCFGYSILDFPSKELVPFQVQHVLSGCNRSARKYHPIFCSTLDDGGTPDDSEDSIDKDKNCEGETGKANSETYRENLERIVGTDDSAFSGIDLATLIRNRYGRSYDVQLIKKEFMGRNLLALNVMWKYMEQRSFPLTEEEYLLRLDDVANTLKCWGAVSHIRNSLQKMKERPRIGKAVSIFIDMDESGGRANEWIYK
ncbi:uncharacterized protein LOC132276135 [Cornus florida]|uniref:uncharacterized protein LOC132276135 n=1 Tax=Cornus florida TaxID=4283 RepID=UPI00289A0210|nr:uncharacterized protein LOC132276135 [Cornus florida]